MKVYAQDFNNVLADVLKHDDIKLVDDPRDGDVILLWQDVRGELKELCEINEKYLKKPVVVVQHGRGATRDYLPPNNFKMYATKFCCWGEPDYARLAKAGYGARAIITGSPLIHKIKPKQPHDGKNIVFVPIITEHEEPENIITYLHLKSIETKKMKELIEKNKNKLKSEWHSWIIDPGCVTENSIPRYVLNKNWRLLSKLTPIHDKGLYVGDIVTTHQINKNHLEDCIKLLSITDCVVGIEEGTFQLIAQAMDIPTIMVDNFKWDKLGGVDYSKVEVIKTSASEWTTVENLEKVIDKFLENPRRLRRERKEVVKREFGDLNTNPVNKIVDVLKNVGGVR